MTIKKQIKKAISSTIDTIIDIELAEWPPKCASFLYQPIRPVVIKDENISYENIDNGKYL